MFFLVENCADLPQIVKHLLSQKLFGVLLVPQRPESRSQGYEVIDKFGWFYSFLVKQAIDLAQIASKPLRTIVFHWSRVLSQPLREFPNSFQ